MQATLAHLKTLENSIIEESQKTDLLLPFIQEIRTALDNESYVKALQLLDELEEFMDLEFCNRL